jgi:hypothetical protein
VLRLSFHDISLQTLLLIGAEGPMSVVVTLQQQAGCCVHPAAATWCSACSTPIPPCVSPCASPCVPPCVQPSDVGGFVTCRCWRTSSCRCLRPQWTLPATRSCTASSHRCASCLHVTMYATHLL